MISEEEENNVQTSHDAIVIKAYEFGSFYMFLYTHDSSNWYRDESLAFSSGLSCCVHSFVQDVEILEIGTFDDNKTSFEKLKCNEESALAPVKDIVKLNVLHAGKDLRNHADTRMVKAQFFH